MNRVFFHRVGPEHEFTVRVPGDIWSVKHASESCSQRCSSCVPDRSVLGALVSWFCLSMDHPSGFGSRGRGSPGDLLGTHGLRYIGRDGPDSSDGLTVWHGRSLSMVAIPDGRPTLTPTWRTFEKCQMAQEI